MVKLEHLLRGLGGFHSELALNLMMMMVREDRGRRVMTVVVVVVRRRRRRVARMLAMAVAHLGLEMGRARRRRVMVVRRKLHTLKYAHAFLLTVAVS